MRKRDIEENLWSKYQGYWRIRRNEEFRQLYRESEISDVIGLNRLQWAGYMIRMDEQGRSRRAIRHILKEGELLEDQEEGGKMQ